jgi:hypothetical protein
MACDVFISHSVKDERVADAVVAKLEAESVTCWIVPRDVVPGADWGESIINAIESSRIMILIFSQSANASSQIEREVERAVNKGIYIIPFRVDDIEPTRSLEISSRIRNGWMHFRRRWNPFSIIWRRRSSRCWPIRPFQSPSI